MLTGGGHTSMCPLGLAVACCGRTVRFSLWACRVTLVLCGKCGGNHASGVPSPTNSRDPFTAHKSVTTGRVYLCKHGKPTARLTTFRTTVRCVALGIDQRSGGDA